MSERTWTPQDLKSFILEGTEQLMALKDFEESHEEEIKKLDEETTNALSLIETTGSRKAPVLLDAAEQVVMMTEAAMHLGYMKGLEKGGKIGGPA